MDKYPAKPGFGKTEKRCGSCQAWNTYDAERCADCGVHFNKRKKRGAEEGPSSDGRCEWNINGKRCHYPAAVGGATNGYGPWYCSLHADCHDSRIGEDFVKASADYKPFGKYEREQAHQAIVGQWLKENGLAGDKSEAMDYQRKFAKRAQTSDRGVDIAWARRILERRDSGEVMPFISMEKAGLVLRIKND